MEYLKVKNWSQFQHYKDRNPPWIKLHFALLSSPDWVMLDDASRVLAIACMLIASRNEGQVPNNPAYIKRVAYLNRTPDLKPLIECGFLESASGSKQVLAEFRPEERRDREDTASTPSGAFLRFWGAWPSSSRKQSRGQCWERWRKQDFDQIADQIIAHVDGMKQSMDWRKDSGAFIPAPLVYLNQKRWEGAEAVQAPEKRLAV